MRSLRDWIAAAPTAALAAALAVVVIGAGLSGFAIAELTSDDSSPAPAQQTPAVVGGSSQPGLSTDAAIIATVSDRDEAVRLARNARSRGARVKIVRFGGGWLVLSQSSQ
jgi:cation diffusion facilitator CzcD-associated flavoprotein CzcO